MNLEDFLKVYQRGEKFLILNTAIPAWIVTNLNGVLTVKAYVESQSDEKAVEELGKYAENIPAQSVLTYSPRLKAGDSAIIDQCLKI